jgi:hypothetical protein
VASGSHLSNHFGGFFLESLIHRLLMELDFNMLNSHQYTQPEFQEQIERLLKHLNGYFTPCRPPISVLRPPISLIAATPWVDQLGT